MKTDLNGNVYVTGEEGGIELFAAKLSPTGSLIYFVDLGTSGINGVSTVPASLAVGPDGSVHVLFSSIFIPFGMAPITPSIPSTITNLDPAGKIIPNGQLIASFECCIAALATDSSGNLFVTGGGPNRLASTPGSASNLQGNGFTYAIDPTLTKVLWAVNGYGGSYITVGAQGVVYLVGITNDAALPTINAFQPTYNATVCGINCNHQFLTALSASGTEVLFSTYLTGTSGENPAGIAVDDSQNVYVAGTTTSTDYPVTTNALQNRFPAHEPGSVTGYISSLDPTGKVRFSTFFGGSDSEFISEIAVGTGNDALYVEGYTTSPDLPGLSVPDHDCVPQYFVTQLATDGSAAERTLLLSDSEVYVPSAVNTILTSQGGGLDQLNFIAPEAPITCLANSAYLSPTTVAAPGQLITMFGNNLAATPQAATVTDGTFPTSQEGVSVLINGVAAPLLYVSPNQINFQMPFETAAQSQVTLQLQTTGTDGPQIADSRTVSIASSLPTVFQIAVAPGECPGSYLGETKTFALNQDGTLNGCANPAQPNSTVTIFVDGLGNLVPSAQTGEIAPNMSALTIPISLNAGQSAPPAPLFLSANALAGSISGLYAIHLQVLPISTQAELFIGSSLAIGPVAIAVTQ